LVFHANIYLNAGAVRPDACVDTSRELRRAASDLLRALMLINARRTLALVRLPPAVDIDEAAKLLIGLSNSVTDKSADENDQRRQDIRKKLRITPG
jgi:hypothetical protein